MNIEDKYDFGGPFQVSQGKAYIKHDYIPYNMGTIELEMIIHAKINALEVEKAKWVALDSANHTAIRQAQRPGKEVL
tara:strand:- start:1801 stop:2031 length:231 start_codon:yes stop_codon:yes gene_type:complete